MPTRDIALELGDRPESFEKEATTGAYEVKHLSMSDNAVCPGQLWQTAVVACSFGIASEAPANTIMRDRRPDGVPDADCRR